LLEGGNPLSLPQHADEHRPQGPVLLAIDQELGDEIIDASEPRPERRRESMTDTERHDCQPPFAESIGQIWTCPVCGDAWRVEEGAPIGGDAYTWVRSGPVS
jgi:hypothetical protein